jgi:hypothetical protein
MDDKKKVSSISQASSYEEMAEFWDTHSLADYDAQTYEVDMVFNQAARRSQVNIDPDLLQELRQIALRRHISTQTLINLWLSERVTQLKTQAAP